MKSIKLGFLFITIIAWQDKYLNSLYAQPLHTDGKVASKDGSQQFYFINDKTDSSSFRFIRRIHVKGAEGRATIQELYYNLRQKAMDAGANGYKKPFYHEANNTLQAEVFLISENGIKENLLNEDLNTIYIFGRERSPNKKLAFYINEVKFELRGGHYFKSVLAEGTNIKVRKGGITGSTMNITWKQQAPATYIALSGIQLVDPQYSGPNTLAVSPGNMMVIEQGLGRLYLRLLKPMQEP